MRGGLINGWWLLVWRRRLLVWRWRLLTWALAVVGATFSAGPALAQAPAPQSTAAPAPQATSAPATSQSTIRGPSEGAAPASATAPAGPAVVGPQDVTPDQYALLLKPSTKAELEQVAGKWQQALQQKATEIARTQVLAQRSGGNTMRAKLAELDAQQDQIAVRYRVVLEALEAKGGDTAEQRAYLSSVTAGNILDNPAVLSTQVVKWLKAPDGGVRWGLRLAAFLGTLLVARLLAGVTGRVVERAMGMSKVRISELLRSFFVHTSQNGVMILGLVIGVSFLGVPVGPFLAAMGAIGFIVGFALQDVLGNFAAGLMILFYRPYDLEDVVNVSSVTGKVRAMSLVSTTLLTPDNQLVVVPNRSIWGGIITNITGNSTRRVDLTFGIGYNDDLRHAQRVLEQLVESHPLVLSDPPLVRVHELADSSVNLICRPWVKTADYWDVYWDLTRMVKETFDAEGISIPFPQRDVHMHTPPAPAAGDHDDHERADAPLEADDEQLSSAA